VVAPGPRWRARIRQRIFRVAPSDLEPVVLRHSRIYVLPTPRGIAFIATLATMLVLSLNYALSLGFVITFLLSGLTGAALLHTFRNLAGLSLRPLAAGEPSPAIRCRSRSRSAPADGARRYRHRAGDGEPVTSTRGRRDAPVTLTRDAARRGGSRWVA
jgi:hypothetical protein